MIGVSVNLYLTIDNDAPARWDGAVFVHRDGKAQWIDSTGTDPSLKATLEQCLRIARAEVAAPQLERLA